MYECLKSTFNVKTNKKKEHKQVIKTLEDTGLEWPKRKKQANKMGMAVSPHKLIMHIHEVARLSNYTFLCAWCQCPQVIANACM